MADTGKTLPINIDSKIANFLNMELKSEFKEEYVFDLTNGKHIKLHFINEEGKPESISITTGNILYILKNHIEDNITASYKLNHTEK